jgi:hypothetical protein
MPLAQIATKRAKYTLDQPHAELAGKLLDNKVQAERLILAMKHVEAVLKLLDPEYNLRPIAIRRRKPNPYFQARDHFPVCLGCPQGGRQAAYGADAMLAAKGITDATPKAVRTCSELVQTALRAHEGRSVTEDMSTDPARWSI